MGVCVCGLTAMLKTNSRLKKYFHSSIGALEYTIKDAQKAHWSCWKVLFGASQRNGGISLLACCRATADRS